MELVIDDGGRAVAGFKGNTGDCVCRAVAIAAELPYKQVYEALSCGTRDERRTDRSTNSGHHTARLGIHTGRKWFKEYMASLGFTWTPTMFIGIGCKVHLRADELPAGRIIVSLSNHYAAVIDGVVHDTYLDDRDGRRCVYGYWSKP